MQRVPIELRTDVSPVLLPAPRAPMPTEGSPVTPAPVSAATAASAAVQWQRRYRAVSVCIDLCAAAGAATVAEVIRFGERAPTMYARGALVLVPAWLLLVLFNRTYERRFIGIGTEEFVRVVRSGVTLMAGVAVVSYVSKASLSRGYVLVAVPGVILGSLLGRLVQRQVLHHRRRVGRSVHRTLLVGPEQDVADTVRRLRAEPGHGMTVVSACLTGLPRWAGTEVAGLGVQARTLSDLESAVRDAGVDVVIVLSTALITGVELRRLAWRLEQLGADLVVCAGLTEIAGSRLTVRATGYTPMLSVRPARLSGPSRLLKGVFDRVMAAVGLVALAPLLAGVALAIWFEDGGKPFFCQTRVGLNGREFRMVKFRTMVPDAEARRAELLSRNESDGVLFKIADDPRVTRIGRKLRKHSVDELPQLLNVVRGDMSLVGPRPPLPSEVAGYGADMRRRLLVKPGMTGLWQISGRSSLNWAQTEQLDIRYVENWSLGGDLGILWRTARVVRSGSGAY
jgi:exopolysaccharide biosynthesis polyprenyl glycosylphosphotransferase